jgi:hypothetical protein
MRRAATKRIVVALAAALTLLLLPGCIIGSYEVTLAPVRSNAAAGQVAGTQISLEVVDRRDPRFGRKIGDARDVTWIRTAGFHADREPREWLATSLAAAFERAGFVVRAADDGEVEMAVRFELSYCWTRAMGNFETEIYGTLTIARGDKTVVNRVVYGHLIGDPILSGDAERLCVKALTQTLQIVVDECVAITAASSDQRRSMRAPTVARSSRRSTGWRADQAIARRRMAR